MTFSISILFGIALMAGLIPLYFSKLRNKQYKYLLVFAGSYLFSLTIIHILPELFHEDASPGIIGVFVLGGFFFQQGLEFLSRGVEHGHLHNHQEAHHHHTETSALVVLLALFTHAFLEGGLLVHPGLIDNNHDMNTLLWGIAIHKAPEAFALMSVLLLDVRSKWRAILYLVIFASASPLGISISDYLITNQWVSSRSFNFLLAFVSGSFLHISTTIVFESNANHTFNVRKTVVALLAATIAVMVEIFL